MKRKIPLRSHKVGQKPKYLKKSKLRVRSKKRQKEEAQYNERVKEWKLEHPNCEACFKIYAWTGGREGNPDPHLTVDNHHAAGKEGALLLDERWWRAVCRWAHDWIRDHANTARELDLLAPKNM